MDEFPPPLPPPPPPPPMTLDGAENDTIFAKMLVLSKREVTARRLRRTRQLRRCYRGHYWALMEEIKSKYKEYYWTYGKSPFKETSGVNHAVVLGDENNNNANGGNERNNNAALGVGGDDVVRCAFGGCKIKAMALTRYCHAHILSDPKQKLYRGCRTVAKNLPTGPSYCNKPVLRSVVPATCTTHYQLGEKCLLRAVKRAGYNVPINRKPNVKLHVVVNEFVSQIKNKRKVALKAAVSKVEAQ
ncbi:uncharacterized protein LOC107469443 [Arachis duranensis]|uniref:Uncharacterized protein LOC107469443 n=1 Tax=Arachis duranensis TaxID=130453 RepID=A0A6P4BWG4_ARADU|nr:uncharacterized protein LOC107469443 [Arachis duranensis]